jgi:hypothetical protein
MRIDGTENRPGFSGVLTSEEPVCGSHTVLNVTGTLPFLALKKRGQRKVFQAHSKHFAEETSNGNC